MNKPRKQYVVIECVVFGCAYGTIVGLMLWAAYQHLGGH